MAEDDTDLTSTITYQADPPKKSLPSLYVKLFPYELLFLLFQFSERFYRLLYQQYYFQQLAKQTLAEITNYTAPTDQFCLDQDYVVNYTGDERFLEFQDTVNRLNMYTEVIFLGLSALVALVLGPLSDIIGRKPIMLISVLGLVLNGVMQFIIVHYNLNVYYYLLCAAFFGGFGGFSTTMTVMLGTIFDVTPKKWLTIRNGIIELCVALAKTTTAAASNNWIQKTGCDFEPPAWLMIAVTALAMLLGLIMPETLSKELKLKYKAQSSRGFKKLINGVKFYTLPKYIGLDKYWQMITATSVIVLASFGLGASNQIMNYFLHNEPLEWSYDIIGIFGVLYSGSMGLALILILPILVWFGLSNSLICLLGALCAVSTNVVMATVKTTWEMFLAGGLQGILILCYPTMRSHIANLVGTDNQGSVFSIATSLQVSASVVCAVVSNEIYHPQITRNGHKNNAGIVFWVMAGSWALTLPLILLLLARNGAFQPKEPKESFPSEKEPLLQSTGIDKEGQPSDYYAIGANGKTTIQ